MGLCLAGIASVLAEEPKPPAVAPADHGKTNAAALPAVAEEAGPEPAPIKVKMPGPLGNPKLAGLKRYASQAELDQAFGAGGVTLERAVDFAKEDLVCVGWLAGVPAGRLKWKSSAPDGIKFYVEERPARIHGHVMMVRAEWFTVPKGTPAVRVKGVP